MTHRSKWSCTTHLPPFCQGLNIPHSALWLTIGGCLQTWHCNYCLRAFWKALYTQAFFRGLFDISIVVIKVTRTFQRKVYFWLLYCSLEVVTILWCVVINCKDIQSYRKTSFTIWWNSCLLWFALYVCVLIIMCRLMIRNLTCETPPQVLCPRGLQIYICADSLIKRGVLSPQPLELLYHIVWTD